MNFDRFHFVAERAEPGEGREALSVEIPENRGRSVQILPFAVLSSESHLYFSTSFFGLLTVVLPRAVTELVYRYGSKPRARLRNAMTVRTICSGTSSLEAAVNSRLSALFLFTVQTAPSSCPAASASPSSFSTIFSDTSSPSSSRQANSTAASWQMVGFLFATK